jgi:hypothetical protein
MTPVANLTAWFLSSIISHLSTLAAFLVLSNHSLLSTSLAGKSKEFQRRLFSLSRNLGVAATQPLHGDLSTQGAQ